MIFSKRTAFFALLWLLTLGLLGLRPLSDLDLFTQLRLGALALAQRTLLSHEPLVYPALGRSIANPGWLSQLVFAALQALGGLRAVKLFHDACFAGALLIALLPDRARPAGHTTRLPALLALLLALLVGASNSGLRAQGLALFAFALLEMHCRRRSGSLLALGGLFLVWQNIHPSLGLGSALICSALIESYFRKQPGARFYIPLLMLSLVCQLLTPDGTRLFSLSTENAAISRDLLRVSEWLPPWDPAVRSAMPGFWIALAATLALMAGAPRKRLASLPFAAAPFLALSLYSARFAVWWAVIMIPFWHEALAEFPAVQRLQGAFSRLDWRWGLALALFAFVYSATRPIPLSAGIPIASVRRLAESLPDGRIYNYREWAGPLVFFGSPRWQVAIDGRLYLYSEEQWNDYRQEALGEAPLSRIVAAHRPDAFFLRPSFQGPLLEALRKDTQWEVCFEDHLSAIVLPNGACRGGGRTNARPP